MTNEVARDEITISGETFSVPHPYVAGASISDGEAAVLNRALSDTGRSKFAKKVEVAKKNGTFDADMIQAELDEFFDEFEFGQASAGRSSSDPIMSAAMDIARDSIRKAIRKAGGTLKGKNKDITARAVLLFKRTTDKDSVKADEIIALAKSVVAAANTIDDTDLAA